jgi:hypothetical protein
MQNRFVKGIVKFNSVLLLKSAIWQGFQTTVISLHSTSRTNPATYCDKTGFLHPEEVNCKTKAHRSGIFYLIPQEALPASSADQLESTAYSRAWRLMKGSATRGANVRLYPDNDRAGHAGDRDCSTSELTTAVSQCVSVLQ